MSNNIFTPFNEKLKLMLEITGLSSDINIFMELRLRIFVSTLIKLAEVAIYDFYSLAIRLYEFSIN